MMNAEVALKVLGSHLYGPGNNQSWHNTSLDKEILRALMLNSCEFEQVSMTFEWVHLSKFQIMFVPSSQAFV